MADLRDAEQWQRASEDFFTSFHNYDEAGSPQRIQVLKYLVLAYLLMGSDIDPFDSQETKPYRQQPEIKAVTDLVGAYQRREVHEAEKILRGMSLPSTKNLSRLAPSLVMNSNEAICSPRKPCDVHG
jgi:hypothetical protein